MAGDIGLHKRAERAHTKGDKRSGNAAKTFLMISLTKKKCRGKRYFKNGGKTDSLPLAEKEKTK